MASDGVVLTRRRATRVQPQLAARARVAGRTRARHAGHARHARAAVRAHRVSARARRAVLARGAGGVGPAEAKEGGGLVATGAAVLTRPTGAFVVVDGTCRPRVAGGTATAERRHLRHGRCTIHTLVFIMAEPPLT